MFAQFQSISSRWHDLTHAHVFPQLFEDFIFSIYLDGQLALRASNSGTPSTLRSPNLTSAMAIRSENYFQFSWSGYLSRKGSHAWVSRPFLRDTTGATSVRFKSLVDSRGVDHATSEKKLLPQLSYSSFTSHFIIHRWESKQDRHSTLYFAWQDIQFTRYHHNGCFKWIENPALSSRSLVFFRYFCDKELFLIPTFLLLRLPSFDFFAFLIFFHGFLDGKRLIFSATEVMLWLSRTR